jgi:hypothetical protein
MQATAEKIEPLFRADVEAAWARFIEGNVPLGLIL